jgi:hypothetical protein
MLEKGQIWVILLDRIGNFALLLRNDRAYLEHLLIKIGNFEPIKIDNQYLYEY